MLQQQLSKAPAQLTPDIPSKVYLDMTPDCNLYCIMCRESIENTGRIMDLDLFKRIIDETCEGVTSYSMFNSGESLLLPDFKERLEYVSKRKQPSALIDLSTNGTLLTEETSRYLIDHDVEVSISFDASIADAFEKIRRGSNFKKICENIERISGIASKMNPFRAPGIAISIQKENWTDLTNIVNLADNLGVRRISMWPVANPESCRFVPDEETTNMVADAIHQAENLGMAVDMYPVRLGSYIWNGNKYVVIGDSYVDTNCSAPFTCVSIAWNGDVYLCCNYGDTVENINGKSFQEVWHGEKYNRLRRRVNGVNLPKNCKNCFWVNRF